MPPNYLFFYEFTILSFDLETRYAQSLQRPESNNLPTPIQKICYNEKMNNIKHRYSKPFIDFHTHLFPETLYSAIKKWFLENVNWRFSFKGDSMQAMSFLENVSNLENYVVLGYAHKQGIAEKLNEFYIELKRKSSKAIPLGTIHQDDVNMEQIVNKALDNGLCGFKIHCQVQKVAPDDKRFEPLYKILTERKGFILFHAGTAPFPSEHLGYKHFKNFLKKYPHVLSVVAHLGAFESDSFLAEAIDHENLFLDTSYAFIANPTNSIEANLKLIEKASNKILFGSDFPSICHSYEEAIESLANLPLPEQVIDNIFYNNGKNFLTKIFSP